MARYFTGRMTGGAQFGGALGGNMSVTEDLAHPMPEYSFTYWSFSAAVQTPGGDLFEISGGRENQFAPAARWHIEITVMGSSVDWDVGNVYSAYVDMVDPIMPVYPYNVDMTGSWGISIGCDEVVEVAEGDFPTFGGSASDDFPKEGDLSIYLVAPVGARVVIAVALAGGGSLSVGGTVTTAFRVNPVASLMCQAVAKADGWGGDQSTAAAIAGHLLISGNTTDLAGGITHVGTYYAGVMTGGGISVAVTNPSDGTGPISYLDSSSETVEGDVWAARSVNFEAQLRGPNGAYPDTIRVRYYGEPGSPGYVDGGTSHSLTQVQYACAAGYYAAIGGLLTNGASSALDEFNALYCHLLHTDLVAAGEDPRLWRCLQHGFYRAGIGLSQASTVTLDSGSTSATGPASISRSYSNYSTSYAGQSLNGYRYLRLELTADAAGQPAQIVIGSKVWSVTVQETGHVEIDLLSPTNASATTDSADSHWPVPSEWGPLTGVQHCSGIIINSLAAGHVYTLAGITLRRKSSVTFTALPEFQNWLQEAAPTEIGATTTTTFVRRYLLADTDGKQSLEVQDVDKVEIESSGGTNDSYDPMTVGAFISNLNTPATAPNDGWTGTNSCAPPGSGCGADPAPLNCYLNSNGPLLWAGGGGATHDSSGWTYWQGVDAGSGVTLPLQMVFDKILDWYGGCGDVFGGGGVTGALELRSAVFLRGLSWGTVVDNASAPVSGGTVALQLASDHSAAGSGTTDAQGRYVTGAPWGKGLLTYDTIAQVPPTPYSKITRTFFSRKWHRAGFRGGTTLINPFCYSDRPGLSNFHQTGIDGRKALYSRSLFATPQGGWDVDQIIVYEADGSHKVFDLRCMRDDRETVVAFYCRSDNDGANPNVYRKTSNDDGATWEDAVLMIDGGKHPTVAVGQDGTFYIEIDAAYVENATPSTGGVIKAKSRAAGEIDFSDGYTFKDDSGTDIAVADDTFHLQQSPEGPGRWVLHCLEFDATASSRFESGDDGKTWKKIT